MPLQSCASIFLFLQCALAVVGIQLRWVAAYYLFICLITAVTYWQDKSRARRALYRIPENYLFVLDYLGGFCGAVWASKLFRHKTRKALFYFHHWLALLLHTGLLIFML